MKCNVCGEELLRSVALSVSLGGLQVCGPCIDRIQTRPIQDQPPPQSNDNPAVWPMVIRDMEERNQIGIERYGTPLQANNGRDALIDLSEELLDAIVYCRQFREEMRCLGTQLRQIHALLVVGKSLGKENIAEAVGLLESVLRKNPALVAG